MDTIQTMEGLSALTFETEYGLKFKAACIGGRDNWSLKVLYDSELPWKLRDLAVDLGDVMKRFGAEQVYAPTPGFNAEFIDREDLTGAVHLTSRISTGSMCIWRNKEKPADCAPLYHKGAAGVFSAGGCPVVVATQSRYMLFAHAGRESILDPALVKGGRQSREHESVANTVVHNLRKMNADSFKPGDIETWIFGSIKAEDLFHPFYEGDEAYRERNKNLWAFTQRYGEKAAYSNEQGVYLDLPEILRQQFLNLGVSADRINIGNYSYVPSHLPTTRNGGGDNRYLSAVVRTQ